MTGKFDVNCPKCGTKITVPAEKLGKHVTCTSCKASILIDDSELKKNLKKMFSGH